jgi:hypothetical protein
VPERVFHDKQLRLMRMETKLVEALHDHPGAVDRRTEHALRYALGLAQLHTFQPGAAAVGRRTDRPDIDVRHPELVRFRHLLLEHFAPLLLSLRSSKSRLDATVRAFGRIHHRLRDTRRAVLEAHAHDFSAAELDQEVGTKTLVNIAGGGGGSGYVYIGAWEVLQQAGLVPGYIIGSSIGAVLGLFRARQRIADYEDYIRFCRGLKYETAFRVMSFRARYGLPGVLRLFLHAAIVHSNGISRSESTKLLPSGCLNCEPIAACKNSRSTPGRP